MNDLMKAANAGEYSAIKREQKKVTLGIPEDIITGYKEVKGVQYPTVYWDQLSERFPMTWVHCVDFHVNSEDLEVCTVISMCEDCEVNKVMQDLRRAGYGCSSRRTTEMEMDFLYDNIELERRTKPYFDIVTGTNRIHTMLDIGADFSVYTKDIETLQSKLPDLITTNVVVYISGFEGTMYKSKMYIIPELFIGNTKYINVPITCIPNDKLSAELVIAHNILAFSTLDIDCSNGILNITKVRDTVLCSFICEYRADKKENVWVRTFTHIQE